MATDANSFVEPRSFDAEILGSVVGTNASELDPDEARIVLKWRFSEADFARMHELAQKNRDDALDSSEREELESFLRIGTLLNILHAKARNALAKSKGE